jgi:hypothetical protein
VEWSCSQLLQNTPLHPIAEWGRQRFGGADVPAERRLADLENSLAQVKLDAAENAPLLAPLLDIPLPKERVPILERGYAHFHFAVFEMLRRSVSASAPHIETLVNVSRTHEMEMWTAYGKFFAPWLRRGPDGTSAVLAEMRDGIATCREQSIGNYIPFLTTALAEAEAQAGEVEQGLATIDGVIGDSERSRQRWFAAETHRIRGEILLKHDPTNIAPAEEAFLTAVAIAQAEGQDLRAASRVFAGEALRIDRPLR